MLNPDRFHEIPDEVSKNINVMQNWAIQRIAEDIMKNNDIGGTNENLLDILQRTNAFGVDFGIELATMTRKTLDEIDKILAGTVAEMHFSDKATYDLIGKAFVPYEENEYLQQLTRSMATQTKGTFMNLTQTRALGFRDSNGAFVGQQEYLQSRLQQTQFNVSTGAQSYNEAIRETVKEMANSGLRYFDYESGRSDSIEVATRRAILTGITQLAGSVSEYNAVQLEARHVQVSRHTGARTGNGLGDIGDHYYWQGRIYELSAEFVRNLSTTTNHAE